jgi:hypothetical protein
LDHLKAFIFEDISQYLTLKCISTNRVINFDIGTY